MERRHLSFANFPLGCLKQMSWQTFQVLFCRLTDEQRDIYRTYLNSQEVKHIFDGRFRVFVGLINLRKICKSCFKLQTQISDQAKLSPSYSQFFSLTFWLGSSDKSLMGASNSYCRGPMVAKHKRRKGPMGVIQLPVGLMRLSQR